MDIKRCFDFNVRPLLCVINLDRSTFKTTVRPPLIISLCIAELLSTTIALSTYKFHKSRLLPQVVNLRIVKRLII